mgnify:FL=1
MAKNQYKKEPLKNNVEEMFIGPFGSSLKNECFVDEEDAYCMVYEQKHAIQKTLDGKNRFVDKNKYYELKRFTIKPGDIIVSCRGTIGETFIVPENAPLGIMHPSIMKIRLKPNVYNIEYFNLLLKNRLKDYNKSANGSGIKMAISATELGKEMFPIPPMDEQQKVSKIFLTVDRLIVLRQQQLAKLDELVKARFVEMFGGCKTNPKNWKTKALEKIANVGSSKRVFVEELQDSGIPFYRGTEIGALAEKKTVKPELFITEEHYKQLCESTGKPQKGDLLMPSICPDGRIWIVDTDEPFYFKDGRVLWVHLTSANYNSVFLLYTLKDRIMTDYASIASGTTFAELKIFALKKCKVFDVPLELQNQFANFVECVDQQKQTVQRSLEKLELMKKALMQEYFE